ncbi:MarR family transcriptional regulator [Glutamicibacter sp. JL.03c]|uniref:MarR family winged helix-turn-helix transcriptional regulator n=1 Tax=Glutamicibacter sp. JL.03c TaxID=2984842 RepID=UPI0021F77B0A|nr:MarR family transcriptional regulator [Glutamicibacter sp. JL.03c]UYQ77196.1 MarR family transcriptional regulator [Glutamicibacter sp. JL.03c]
MSDFLIPQFQWNSLSYLTSRAGRIGTRELTELMESESLTRNHFMVVCALAEFGPMAQHELAKRSQLNRGHLVAYLDELADRQILERSVDRLDRRRKIISLTEAGKEFTARATAAAERSEAEVFGALDAQQQQALRSLLQLVATQEGRAGA